MQLLKKFENDSYLLCEVKEGNTTFVYLKDKKQITESLGVLIENIDLEVLWKDYTEKGTCLPCELLLKLDPKVLAGENSIAELGLTLEKLETVRRIVDEKESKVRS